MNLKSDLEKFLNELGVIAQPQPKQPKQPKQPVRPEGPPNMWQGVWYADGNIPH